MVSSTTCFAAQECHFQGVYYNKEHKCNTPVQVLIALTVIIKY